jgi:arylsulfatase
MFGCRAIYHRGWKAVTYHEMYGGAPAFEADDWELYDVTTDQAECHNLASEQPDRLRELIDKWWEQAERYQVLPLDDRPLSELVLERPDGLPERRRYIYYPMGGMVPEAIAARLYDRSHRVIAEVEVGDVPVEGVLASQGNVLGGWVLFIRDNTLTYVHNYVRLEEHRIAAPLSLSPGRHTIAFDFTRTAPNCGIGQLSVDGEALASADIAPFTPLRFSLTGAGLTCGRSDSAPVCDDYVAPYRFTGTLHQVTIELDGESPIDPEGEAAVAIATQ